jgi:hypothetical protein
MGRDRPSRPKPGFSRLKPSTARSIIAFYDARRNGPPELQAS